MVARATILDFRSERYLLLLIYRSPRYFLSSFKSMGLSVQDKKFKIDFQGGNCSGHLGYLIRMILAISNLQSPQCFLSSLKSVGLSVQEKKGKIDFEEGGHGGQL